MSDCCSAASPFMLLLLLLLFELLAPERDFCLGWELVQAPNKGGLATAKGCAHGFKCEGHVCSR